MIEIFFKSLGDLTDRRIIGIFIRSMLLTLLVFLGLGAVAGWAIVGFDPCDWFDASCPLDVFAGGLSAAALTVLAIWFLFPAIALGILCGFLDKVIATVEARHYPQALIDARSPGAISLALLGLRSATRVLTYNILAIPFYILLLFTVVGPAFLFIAVNGLALGRDLGDMAAIRHGDRQSRREWLRASRGDRFLIGAAATFLFLIPFINLLAPILSAAMVAHLYHRWS